MGGYIEAPKRVNQQARARGAGQKHPKEEEVSSRREIG
jgi:hypothetical protein